MIDAIQAFAASFPDWLQWAGVLLVSAIPFIDSYFGSVIGVAIGVNPVVAITVAIIGNVASMLAFVYGASAARRKVTAKRTATRAGVAGGEPVSVAEVAPQSPKQARIRRWFDRFGVPGVSILGPLVLPSQFTSLAMVGFGADRKAVIIWQTVAIVIWGVLFGALATLGVHVAVR